MTEDEKYLDDDILKELIGKSTPLSPSGDFTKNVMDQVRMQPVVVPEEASFTANMKSVAGYLLVAAVIAGFFITSDIPFMNWIPGKQSFIDTFAVYFGPVLSSIKSISLKSLSIPLMIVVATGLFFLVDTFLAQRNAARN